VRFKEPDFGGSGRAKRWSSATTAVGRGGSGSGSGGSSSSSTKRTDSFVPPLNHNNSNDNTTPSTTQTRHPARRKSTAASLFGTRSWSIFWDPRISATGGKKPSDKTPSREPATIEAEVGQVENKGKKRSFMKRCKSDRLLQFVLAMVFLVGSGLIVSGVVWTETHRSRVLEDKRDFVCGEGIAGGPKCRVHLKGEKSGMGSADWVGGEVVDWWLKNHCVWRGQEAQWWCGAEIGQKEGEDDQVLPHGTWLEKVEESDEEGFAGPE